MKNSLLPAIAMFTGLGLNAQEMILHDPVTTKIFNAGKYSDMKGSPFLFDKWIRGAASTSSGVYTDLDLKLNAYENTLIFQQNDESYEFQLPINSFVLKPRERDSSSYMYFRRGFTGPSLQASQYVQILTEGKLGLYRSDIKSVSDFNEINRGVVKAFSTVTRYYIKKDAALFLIKPSKDELLSYMTDKKDSVEAFIKEKKLNLKKEIDMIALVKYYNTL